MIIVILVRHLNLTILDEKNGIGHLVQTDYGFTVLNVLVGKWGDHSCNEQVICFKTELRIHEEYIKLFLKLLQQVFFDKTYL